MKKQLLLKRKALVFCFILLVLVSVLVVPACAGQNALNLSPDLNNYAVDSNVAGFVLPEARTMTRSAGGFYYTLPLTDLNSKPYEYYRLHFTVNTALLTSLGVSVDTYPLEAFQLYQAGVCIGTCQISWNPDKTYPSYYEFFSEWFTIDTSQPPPMMRLRFFTSACFVYDLTSGYQNWELAFTIGIDGALKVSDQNAIDRAYNSGYSSGHDEGYSEGLSEDINESIPELILNIISAPFQAINNALNFEIFGFNLAPLVFFALTASIIVFLIKRFTE